MRIAKNIVRIEGILSEVNLEYGSYQKNGQANDCIRGTVKILVEQVINDKPTICETVVHVFTNKFTKMGKLNPSYDNMEKVKTEFKSIASAGGEEGADRVRITNGQITMNEYFNAEGKLITFPRINATFINKISKDECKPQARFDCEMVVASITDEIDSQGEPTGRTKVKGIIPGFSDRVEIVDFICANAQIADNINTFWSINDTVPARGILNFSTKVETIEDSSGFGETIVQQRTRNINELLITWGNSPLEGDLAYEMDEVQAGLTARKERLEAQKVKDMTRAGARKAPAPADQTTNGTLDLGF